MTTTLSCALLFVTTLGQVSAASPPNAVSATGHRCYEAFDYSPFGDALLGKSGGEGFDGPWVAAGFNARDHKAYRVVAGSLSTAKANGNQGYMRTEASPLKEIQLASHPFFDFGDEPPTNGAIRTVKYRPIKGLGRRLASPIEADETVTVYVAALFRPEKAADDKRWGGYAGFYLDGSGDGDLFVGAAADDESLYRLATRGGSGKVKSQQQAEVGRTDLLVVKAELRPGADIFTLYINPNLGVPEPGEGTVKRDLDVGRVSQIVLYSVGAFSLDELRMVDSFDALAD